MLSSRTWQKMFRRAFPDWHCPFCDWNKTFNLHHIKHRKHGGDDGINNIVGLCPNHHSLAHLGEITDEELVKFSIGVYYTEAEWIEKVYKSYPKRQYTKKNCLLCGSLLSGDSNTQKYCEECAPKAKAIKQKERRNYGTNFCDVEAGSSTRRLD